MRLEHPFLRIFLRRCLRIRKKIPRVSSELAVFKDVLVLLVADLVEIVHVELPDKGREVAVPEVGGQDLLLEALNI